MKKYIVIDTWNGEGYSSENGVEIEQFQNKKLAFKHAYKRALENADGDKKYVERYENTYSFLSYDDNHGSYQVWETKGVYAIMIQCNVNEITMLTKEEYEEKIKWLDEQYGDDLEDYSDTDENGDKFYCSLVDDYDYQFRLIKNI